MRSPRNPRRRFLKTSAQLPSFLMAVPGARLFYGRRMEKPKSPVAQLPFSGQAV